MVAYDTGRPNLRTTATVIISVNRNLNGPKVNPPSDAIDVPEDQDPRKWFYPVNVTDPDSVRQLGFVEARAPNKQGAFRFRQYYENKF